MGIFDAIGGAIKGIGRSVLGAGRSVLADPTLGPAVRDFGTGFLGALGTRAVRKATTGFSGDPQSLGGQLRLRAEREAATSAAQGVNAGSLDSTLGLMGFNPLPPIVAAAKNPRVQAAAAGALGALLGSGNDGDEMPTLPGGAVVTRPSGATRALFNPASQRVTPAREFTVFHPVTGKPIVYRNMGRPLLYSGDVACAKRVARVARRASRGRR